VNENFKLESFLDRTVHKQRKSARVTELLWKKEECHGHNIGLKWIAPRPSNKTVPPQFTSKSDSIVSL
jgi:hypothetical protein